MRSGALRLLPVLAVAALGGCGAPSDAADDAEGFGEPTTEEALTPGPYKNGLDRKVYPSNRDRDLACPVAATSAAGYAPAQARLADVEIDARALRGVVPDGFRVAVILVKRVDGVPRYRYLSNGTHDVVYQPWSSTKWIAAANAASRLREASSGRVGLSSSVGGVPLGDMVTGIHTYTPKLSSSNGLSRFMHDVGGRERAHDLVTEWLGRERESFGGNYGEPAPAMTMTFTEPGGARVSIAKDAASGYQNQLSALTEVEILKRLVMHREDAATRMRGLTWADLRVLFYGAEESSWYPGRWGGMSSDKAIFVQSALDVRKVEADAKGRWRIFSKVGYGVPDDQARRGNGELVEVSYACLPVLDAAGRPVPDQGRELFIAAMQGTGGAGPSEREVLFAKNHAAIVERVLDGRL